MTTPGKLYERLPVATARPGALDYLRRIGAKILDAGLPPGTVTANQIGPGLFEELGEILKGSKGVRVKACDPTDLETLALLATAVHQAEACQWTGKEFHAGRFADSGAPYVYAYVVRKITEDDIDAELAAILDEPRATHARHPQADRAAAQIA